MKRLVFFSFFTLLLLGCNYKIGPTIRTHEKDGVVWKKMKIYGYPNGKRKLAEVNLYKNNRLIDSKIYYELWPVGGWKFVSKKGFFVWKNGYYLLKNDSIEAPDNILHSYYDKNHKEVIEVYKDGKKTPYTLGYPDGHQSRQFLVDPPGVYEWKDGKEYFLRPFTNDEKQSDLVFDSLINVQFAIDSCFLDDHKRTQNERKE